MSDDPSSFIRAVPARRGVSAMAVALLALMATVAQAATHVKDDARLFSPQAAQQAEQRLAGVRQNNGPNVIVETFAEPPAEVRDQVLNAANADARGQVFERFAGARAKAMNADVYVLVNKTPGHVRIFEKRELQSRGLPAAQRDQIAQGMVSAFRTQDFDRGLNEGVGQLSRTLAGVSAAAPTAAARQPTATPPAQQAQPEPAGDPVNPPVVPTGGTPDGGGGSMIGLNCCTLLGLGLVALLVITIVKRFMGRGRGGPMGPGGYPPYGGPMGQGGVGQGGPMQQSGLPPQGGYPPQGYPPQGYGQRRGGGFGTGMAGGLLGGVLGSVLGNQMSRGNDGTGNATDGGAAAGSGGAAEDTGYASSGGDFDGPSDASSGGDFGDDSGGDFGGDSSGGDF